MNSDHRSPPQPPIDASALEARFGMQIAARLTAGSQQLPTDIRERLRFARQQALERAQAGAPAVAALGNGGAAVVQLGGGDRPGWAWRLASLLPVVALIAGFVAIELHQHAEQTAVAAEIDAALLADDLPPSAYTDPGFAAFLKTPRD